MFILNLLCAYDRFQDDLKTSSNHDINILLGLLECQCATFVDTSFINTYETVKQMTGNYRNVESINVYTLMIILK